MAQETKDKEEKEALDKVKKDMGSTNYMIIELSYSNKIVLPHKDGVALLAALSKAEAFESSYETYKSKVTQEAINLPTTVITKDTYILYKMNHLLKVE